MKRNYIKFSDLKNGHNKNTHIMNKIYHRNGGESSSHYEIIYVNRKDKEVLIDFGYLKVINSKSFDKRKFQKCDMNETE